MDIKEIFSIRLKSARKLKSLSLDKLVELMDGVISKNSISKYERGLAFPNSEILNALCLALDVSPDYLFRPFKVEFTEFEFRKKAKLNKSKVDSIKELVKSEIEKYIEIETTLNLDPSFKNPYKSLNIKGNADIDKLVSLLREHWSIGKNAIHNVIQLLEEEEIKVIEVDAPQDFDGLCTVANGAYPIIVLNQNFSPERKRFTALHELGHLLLNIDQSIEHKQAEKLCNYFASSMLIDKEVLEKQPIKKGSKLSFHELKYLQINYGVSISALVYRLAEMGKISESQKQSFFYLVRTKNDIKEFVHKDRFSGIERTNRYKQLVYSAFSKEIISISKASTLLNKGVSELAELELIG